MAAVGLPDPLIEIAVKSICAYEAINYKREVKSRKSDEQEYADKVGFGQVLSSYDVHLGIHSRLHGY